MPDSALWIAGGLVLALGLATAKKSAGNIAPTTLGASPRIPQTEGQIIQATAAKFGIDPNFLGAIRLTENGGPGREFGVISVPAPTYQEQATVAARTVSHQVNQYEADTGTPATNPDGTYTADFIQYFAGKWAPVGAENDPANLNQFWAYNAQQNYAALAAAGTEGA